jgi:hypothetical protein
MGWLVAVICGCASDAPLNLRRAPEISLDWGYEQGADFSGMKSFGWLAGPRLTVPDPRVDAPLLEKRVREAVMNELTAKGFTHKLAGTPDFYVSYEAGLKTKLKVSAGATGYGFDPGWGWHHQGRFGSRAGGPNPHVREADAGSLALNIIEPNNQKLLWRGVAEAHIDPERDSERTKIERVNRAVRLLLERFPPKSRPGS